MSKAREEFSPKIRGAGERLFKQTKQQAWQHEAAGGRQKTSASSAVGSAGAPASWHLGGARQDTCDS